MSKYNTNSNSYPSTSGGKTTNASTTSGCNPPVKTIPKTGK